MNTSYEMWVQSAQCFLRKRCKDMYLAVKMSGLEWNVKSQLDLWFYFYLKLIFISQFFYD